MAENMNSVRTKLENMTLEQIRGLKKQIADEVSDYLAGLTAIVHEKFDVGDISISVKTNIEEKIFRFDTLCDIENLTRVSYNIRIKFSKEYE